MNNVIVCSGNIAFRKSGRMTGLFLIGLVFILTSFNVFAENLKLGWTASTSANVTGYIIGYGKTTKNYPSTVDVLNVTTSTLTGLTAGDTYYIAVKAYDNNGNESPYSTEIKAVVPSASGLTADFTANNISGVAPLVVAFTPVTTGTVTGWSWDFGDSAIPVSTSKNPTVTYSTPGVYNVSLTVTGTGGSSTATKPNFITVTATPPPPVANFSATPLSGNVPLSVVFTDSSTGNISSRLWNFGDGSTSTAKNPTHIFNAVGSYTVSLKVTGAGGSDTKTSAGLINVTGTVTSGAALMAAYGFEESLGTLVADASGKGNIGTISQAVRTPTGRFGKALKFDGINDVITVKDSPSLDLSAGLTLEAWVNPQSIQTDSVIFKEQLGGSVYGIYAYDDGDFPSLLINDGVSNQVVAGTQQLPVNQWTHIAATYDGKYQRLYTNGLLVSVRPQNGLIKQSQGALSIGGNSIWGQYFQGYIDEIRIYNHTLTKAEIITDLNTAVSVSNPPKQVIGNKALEQTVDYNPQGLAEAFKTIPAQNGVLTSIQVYLDKNSTATEVIAGIYEGNTNNHPGKLLAQGKISAPKAGATNSVPIPAVQLVAKKTYWFAILGSKGQIKFRNRIGAGNVPLETSASNVLTTLPAQWVTGSVFANDGPMSVYGEGYLAP